MRRLGDGEGEGRGRRGGLRCRRETNLRTREKSLNCNPYITVSLPHDKTFHVLRANMHILAFLKHRPHPLQGRWGGQNDQVWSFCDHYDPLNVFPKKIATLNIFLNFNSNCSNVRIFERVAGSENIIRFQKEKLRWICHRTGQLFRTITFSISKILFLRPTLVYN